MKREPLPCSPPRILPPAWTLVDLHEFGAAYRSAFGLAVIYSVCRELDGRRWLHVSMSRVNRLPSWTDVREVKDTFIGPDRVALQVLPREADYINQHPFCLHLWHCLDGDVTPNFAAEGMI